MGNIGLRAIKGACGTAVVEIPVLECEIGIMRLFGTGDIAERGLRDGWSAHEDGHNWNDGEDASLTLWTHPMPSAPCLLVVEGAPFLAGGREQQRMTLYSNGLRVGFWNLSDGRAQRLVSVIEPEQWLQRNGGAKLNLVWHLPDSVRPVDVGQGGDFRKLGFCFRTIALENAVE